MILASKRTLALLLAALLALPSPWLAADDKSAPANDRKRALHALNRLTFGPRPGEVEQVAAQGVEKWIEKQLRPESIPDRALEARLAPFHTLKMDTREMVENFPPPQLLRAVAQGRADMPSDPKQRAVYEAALERYRQRQKRQQAAGQNAPPGKAAEDGMPSRDMDDDGRAMDPEERAARREARMYAELKAEEMLQLAPEKRLEEFMKMSDDERRALARALGPEERERLFAEFSPEQRETVMAMANPGRVVTTEVQQAKILRAAYSERQLEEVMTDFWFNHFNVFINKGPDRYLVTAYERDAIRPRVLGKFEELLVATAESPAMMFYLDNWQSVGPKSDFAERDPQQRGQRRRQQRGGILGGLGRNRLPGRQQQGNDEQMQRRPQQQQQLQQQQQRRGLNENYARELMELHTLGVNGGYTQKDVTEVARVFTGWTIRQPRLGGDFEYNGRMHDPGDKIVLGQKISAGGKKEGAQVLRMLAQHPSTAKFISTKLAQRFVADEPPAALIERMAATFRKSDGDIREVLRTLFRSPEFWAPEAYRAKVKTPLEFVASAVRATGAEVGNAMTLVGALNRLGMPLYAAQPPTGYSMKAEAWVNSAALLNRMNFALGLGAGRLPGITLDAQQLLRGRTASRDADGALAVLEQSLLAGDVSRETHDTIRKQLNDPKVIGSYSVDAGDSPASGASPASPAGPGVVAGLLLGSPEFQRR